MLLKLLLKFWPSLVPISLYLFWVLIIEEIIIKRIVNRKKFTTNYQIIDAKKQQGNPKPSPFSLKNKLFIAVIFVTILFTILSFFYLAFHDAPQKGQYVPAKIENNQIKPSYFIR